MGASQTPVDDFFWRRHANPKSGWSRIPTGPVLVYRRGRPSASGLDPEAVHAVYRRNWRLLAAALAWTAINPFLFSPPEDETAWMTRAVLAERWWTGEKNNRTIGLDYPNVCNAGSALASLYALSAACRQRPAGATLGTVLMIGCKLWWLRVLVRRYDAQADQSLLASAEES